MLDFYFIGDDLTKPHDPEQHHLEFAGNLDAKSFEKLQHVGLIGSQYDYYSDFRWSNQVTKQYQLKANQSGVEKDSDVRKLIELLERAINKDCGLIAYGD